MRGDCWSWAQVASRPSFHSRTAKCCRSRKVTVWARDPAQAAVLAEGWRSNAMAATVARDLAGAAAQADVVSCATLATAPVVRGVWLRPGSHLDPVAARHCANFHDAHSSPLIMKVISRESSGNRFSNGKLLGPLGLTRPLRTDLLGGLWDNPGVTDPPDGNA